ncbi:MAG: thermonuclease family protein [Actinobacteria bacterium]|nr:thermonuclease family protein [Actinomycetota bacterium]
MSPRGATGWVVVFAVLVLVAVQTIDTGSVGREDTSGSSTAYAPLDEEGEMKPRTARVLRVVDGDTILVRTAQGGKERVRYIGVDTPESVKPNAPVECFGKQAAKFNGSLVLGREVRLMPDREPRDRYGRTLAFVYAGGVFINAELLKRGYARTIEIEPNTSKAEYFAGLERVAIRTNKGLWRACDR